MISSYAVMADAFSSSSENVIQRLVNVEQKTLTPLEELDELYEIKKTCDFISQYQFEKVRTLLPQSWSCFSPRVYMSIKGLQLYSKTIFLQQSLM